MQDIALQTNKTVPNLWLDHSPEEIDKLYAFFMYAEALYHLPLKVADPELEKQMVDRYEDATTRQHVTASAVERAFRVTNVSTILRIPDQIYSGYISTVSKGRKAILDLCKYNQGMVLWSSPVLPAEKSAAYLVSHQTILPLNNADPVFLNLITFYPPHLEAGVLLNAQQEQESAVANETPKEGTKELPTAHDQTSPTPLVLPPAQKRPIVPIKLLNDK